METFATSERGKSNSAVTRHKNKHQPFFAPVKVQPKLTIGAVNDPAEHEADAMADRVMCMPVERECIECEKGKLRRSEKYPWEEKVQKKSNGLEGAIQRKERDPWDERIQKKSQGGVTNGMEAPSIVHDVINSGGRPLDSGTRDFFEPRFGYDFSKVRLHTGSKAAESSQKINAHAYTVGNNIIFSTGQYSTQTENGKRLLAHELTHTIQQDITRNVRGSRNNILNAYRRKNLSGVLQRKKTGSSSRTLPNVLIKRKNIKLSGDDKYGHWWTEITDRNESFGWWPKKPVGFINTIFGTDGELNAKYFGGTSKKRGDSTSKDPHHGDSAEELLITKTDSAQTDSEIKDDIEKFCYSYSGQWRWSFGFGQNCHTFQEALLENSNLRTT